MGCPLSKGLCMQWLVRLTEVFVPMFVAMSPLTVLPIFLGMTEDMEWPTARVLARRAVLTGFFIAIAIVLLGQALFRFLNITIDDLRVGGGTVLLIIGVYDLIFTRERRKTTELDLDAGVVPLGTPLIVGPATMTTCVVLADTHGKWLVVLALSVNILVIWLLLHHANKLTKFIRPSITRAFGKVMSLFLAAIAVAMLRSGIESFVRALS